MNEKSAVELRRRKPNDDNASKNHWKLSQKRLKNNK